MRHGFLFWAAVSAVAVVWVLGVVVALVALHQQGQPWWWLFRGPHMASAVATGAVGLLYWRLGVPGSHIWRVAYRAGQHDAHADMASNVTRLPSQVSLAKRRRSDLS